MTAASGKWQQSPPTNATPTTISNNTNNHDGRQWQINNNLDRQQ
jgi:hypothetical protein